MVWYSILLKMLFEVLMLVVFIVDCCILCWCVSKFWKNCVGFLLVGWLYEMVMNSDLDWCGLRLSCHVVVLIDNWFGLGLKCRLVVCLVLLRLIYLNSMFVGFVNLFVLVLWCGCCLFCILNKLVKLLLNSNVSVKLVCCLLWFCMLMCW